MSEVKGWLTEKIDVDSFFKELCITDKDRDNPDNKKFLGQVDAFVGKMIDGDELWKYDNGAWRSLSGRAGFAIVRDGEIVTYVCTKLS